MEPRDHREFSALVELIREVKPSLVDTDIKTEDLLIETLGFDSLDVMQLARSVRRRLCRDFDQDAWVEGANTHKLSVTSILEAVIAAMAE